MRQVQPTLISPADNSTNEPVNENLIVNVSDPEGNPLTVTYYGRECPPVTAAPDFTLVGLPDTQFYTSQLNGGTNAMYKAQMNWVLNNMVSQNIAFVEGLGDCVQNGDNGGNPVEWLRADTCMKIIEDPIATTLTDGIPYGLNVGNHDQSPAGSPTGSTTFFNQYFGAARFAGRAYYGGTYGSNSDNNYQLFSASGLDFIVINVEYATTMDPAVIIWMQNLLVTYSNRRAIIGTHWALNLNGTFSAQGQAIYNAVKDQPNVFLILCGHVTGESRRSDTYNGNVIHTLMTDYQGRTNGGNGWFRLMKFSPTNNTISVKTYSPWLNQWETDANSEFVINYDMQPVVNFTVLGTNTNVTSGNSTSMPWSSLNSNTCYEWYVTISDGNTTVTSPTYEFSTMSPLPIKLLNFDATLQNEMVNLKWITQTEVNNEYFTVERSKDGKNFEAITKVQGAGTTSMEKIYAAIDKRPLKGVSYYRLKQTDYDGQSTLSQTVAVKNNSRYNLNVYPNPSSDGSFMIGVESADPGTEISIINSSGSVVYSTTIFGNEQNKSITLENFAKGIYILSIKNSSQEEHQRIVVQ